MFVLRGLPDVGPLTHLTIGHDRAGSSPGGLQHTPGWSCCAGMYAGILSFFCVPESNSQQYHCI